MCPGCGGFHTALYNLMCIVLQSCTTVSLRSRLWLFVHGSHTLIDSLHTSLSFSRTLRHIMLLRMVFCTKTHPMALCFSQNGCFFFFFFFEEAQCTTITMTSSVLYAPLPPCSSVTTVTSPITIIIVKLHKSHTDSDAKAIGTAVKGWD